MKVLFYLILLFFLTTIIACTSKKQDDNDTEFFVSVKSIKADTIIISAVYFDGYLICLQQDNKIFVLDTAFKYVDSLTLKFSNHKFKILHSYNDTIFLTTAENIYFLDTAFTLKNYNSNPFKYGLPYFNDSTYYIHACSAGEWGGFVFFFNNKSKRTYFCSATGAQQVFKFNGKYIISNFSAHMHGFSDYISVENPSNLHEIKDENQKILCNWYLELDKLKAKNLFDTIQPTGITYYSDEFITRTMLAFPFKDDLYSVYCTDSATILAKHINFKLITIDTLLKRNINFNEAKTHLANNRSVTAYGAYLWSSSLNSNVMNKYQNTGLIFRNDNKITFLEFKTSYMMTKSNSR